MLRQQQTRNRWLGVLAALLAGLLASQLWMVLK
jgi:hypothetical protein